MTVAITDTVLVLNSGSSSLKYQLVAPESGTSLFDGIVERIGEETSTAKLRLGETPITRQGRWPTTRRRTAGLRPGRRAGRTWTTSGWWPSATGWCGGPKLYRPTVIDDKLVGELRELAPLAPLHNPPAVLGIEVARKLLPDLPHVAVFDTAFFHDLPAAAATYAIDRQVVAEVAHPSVRIPWHVASLRQRASSQFLGAPVESLNQIVLHLGNGASASAIAAGHRSTPRWG